MIKSRQSLFLAYTNAQDRRIDGPFTSIQLYSMYNSHRIRPDAEIICVERNQRAPASAFILAVEGNGEIQPQAPVRWSRRIAGRAAAVLAGLSLVGLGLVGRRDVRIAWILAATGLGLATAALIPRFKQRIARARYEKIWR